MLRQALAAGVMVASALTVPMAISSQPANAAVTPSAIAASNVTSSMLSCWSGNACGTRHYRHTKTRAVRKVIVQERLYVEKPKYRRTYVKEVRVARHHRMHRAYIEQVRVTRHPRMHRAYVKEVRVTKYP
ncbi:hypothetical protein, partial [Microtetraspora malaysiensis]